MKNQSRDSSGSPVVKTAPNAESEGLIPGWGTKIPYAAQCGQKNFFNLKIKAKIFTQNHIKTSPNMHWKGLKENTTKS